MAQIAATVNQDATAPTAGGTEYVLWLSFMNRAVQEWAESADWTDLQKTFWPAISGLSQATISLPQDFKRLAAHPHHYGVNTSVGGKDWPEIIPEQQTLHSNTAEWIYVAGDTNNGFNVIWNPATLASGASIAILYFSTPTSLASPAEIPQVPDSQFLVDRVTAYVFEARSDPRFQQQEVKAREKLLQMVDNNNMNKYSSYAGQNYVTNSTRLQGFRLGRD